MYSKTLINWSQTDETFYFMFYTQLLWEKETWWLSKQIPWMYLKKTKLIS